MISRELFRFICFCSVQGDWDGDHRLWEALAAGALVITDPLHIPLADPLVHGTHLVLFDNNNRSNLMAVLEAALEDPAASRTIAQQGHEHALKYHGMAARIDFVLQQLTSSGPVLSK